MILLCWFMCKHFLISIRIRPKNDSQHKLRENVQTNQTLFWLAVWFRAKGIFVPPVAWLNHIQICMSEDGACT